MLRKSQFVRKTAGILKSAWRFGYRLWRGYKSDKCDVEASSLTYYSLLALVPLIAFIVSLARAFGAGDSITEQIRAAVRTFCSDLAKGASADPSVTLRISETIEGYAEQIFESIANVNFTTLGAMGLATFLWIAFSMLERVENAFNSIWRAPERTLWRKTSDYVAFVIVVPLLAICASSISIVFETASLIEKIMPGLSISTDSLAVFIRYAASFLLLFGLFSFLLILVPNTRVKILPGIIGGFATALATGIWFNMCTALQIGVARNGAIYGGFAAVPILFAWAYVSWQIILLGAELTLALQHPKTYACDNGAGSASLRSRFAIAMAICAEMAKRMAKREAPLDIAEFADRKLFPDRLVCDVASTLAKAGILTPAAADGKDGACFMLKGLPSSITAADVLLALANDGTPPEALGLGNLPGRICALDGEIALMLKSSASQTLMQISGLEEDK